MQQHRYIIGMFLWIGLWVLIYEWLARQLQQGPSSTFLPALVLGTAFILMLPARLRRGSGMLIVIVLYAVLRTLRNTDVGPWPAPSLQLIEILAISITLYLAEILRTTLSPEAIDGTSRLHPVQSERVLPWTQAQHVIANELTRARRHERPLSLTIIGGISADHPKDLSRGQVPNQDELFQEIADIVVASVRRIDQIIWHHEQMRFYVLCPETNVLSIAPMLGRIQQEVTKHLGVRLQIGTSGFPDQAYTFEELVSAAEEQFRGAQRNTTLSPDAALEP